MRSLQSFPQADLGDAPHLGDFPGMESGGGRGGGESTEGSLPLQHQGKSDGRGCVPVRFSSVHAP